MKTIIISIVLLLLISPVFSNSKIKGYVVDEQKEAIAGANIYWLNSKKLVVTNEKGDFEIEKDSREKYLICRLVGYNTDTVTVSEMTEPIQILLSSSVNLAEVSINARALGAISSRVTPLQTQTIGYNELCRAACCNLSESFETNASVDVNYSDAATGAKQIRLLGLSGAYVQMLTENAPNFRGAASLYGLDYVPGPWMESIQVSKGTSSVKNGYEAITGQINVEFKKPQVADPISVNMFTSDAGRFEFNTDINKMLTGKLGSGLLVHYSNDRKVHDANEDGFLDQPKIQQVNLFNRWYYKTDRYVSQLGVKYINEQRESGQSIHVANPYEIAVKTNRGEFFTKNGYIIDEEMNGSVALIFSGLYHNQQSRFGVKRYDVTQLNFYSSLMYETEISGKHQLSTGLSLNYDGLDEYHRFNIAAELPENKRNELVLGGYGQYTFNLNGKLILLAGIRGDHHNEFGFFATPRLHLKFNLAKFLHLRSSVGKGFRSVNVLAENNFYLASSREITIEQGLKMEEATNYGLSAMWFIPLFGKELNVSTEYYYTDFQNQVVADMDGDPHEISYYNLTGKSFSGNFQIEASYPLFRGFSFTTAYRKSNVKTTYRGVLMEKPLANRSKILITTSYQSPLRKWQFDYTLQVNGGGRMPAPGIDNLWEKEFPSFSIMNAQVTKFFRTWSVYIGAENLLNFRQKNPIIDSANPFADKFDATLVWGPVHGQKLYIGFRWSIPKE